MAKQHFVKKARKDIWKKRENGLPDTILIAKGESYYWVKFRYQVKKVSKTPFSSDQLRYGGRYGKPEWIEKYEEFESRVSDIEEDDEDEKDSLRTEIEEYRDELQERLDRIPQQLQENSVLSERIEELDNLINDLN